MIARRSLAFLLVPALLAGCASPEPAYYTLAARPGPQHPGGPRTVEVRRVGLAGYLDRNTIVREEGGVRLQVAGNERWGEPLADMIGRVLAEDLTQRLPGSTVFTEAGAISAAAEAVVEVDVQRFGADASGTVVLLAQVAIGRGRGRAPSAARPLRFAVAPASRSTADLVAAMSAALGQLADSVAAMLRAACPEFSGAGADARRGGACPG